MKKPIVQNAVISQGAPSRYSPVLPRMMPVLPRLSAAIPAADANLPPAIPAAQARRI